MNFLNKTLRTGLGFAMAAGLVLGSAACDDSKGLAFEPGRYTAGGVVGSSVEPESAKDFDFYPYWTVWADLELGADGIVSGTFYDFHYSSSALPDPDDSALDRNPITGSVAGDTFTATADSFSYGEVTVTGTISPEGEVSISFSLEDSELEVGSAVIVKNGDDTAIACGEYETGEVIEDPYEGWGYLFAIYNDGDLVAAVAGNNLQAVLTGTIDIDSEVCDLNGCFGDDDTGVLSGQISYETTENIDLDVDLSGYFTESGPPASYINGTYFELHGDGEDGDYYFNITNVDTDECFD